MTPPMGNFENSGYQRTSDFSQPSTSIFDPTGSSDNPQNIPVGLQDHANEDDDFEEDNFSDDKSLSDSSDDDVDEAPNTDGKMNLRPVKPVNYCPPPKKFTEPQQEYHCRRCNVTCWTLRKYHSHLKGKLHNRLTRFPCLLCNVTFKTLEKFNKHETMKFHVRKLGQTVIPCEICKMGFSDDNQYKTHLGSKAHKMREEAIRLSRLGIKHRGSRA